VNRKVWSAGC